MSLVRAVFYLMDMVRLSTFAHYTGDEGAQIKRDFSRVHECMMYERQL